MRPCILMNTVYISTNTPVLALLLNWIHSPQNNTPSAVLLSNANVFLSIHTWMPSQRCSRALVRSQFDKLVAWKSQSRGEHRNQRILNLRSTFPWSDSRLLILFRTSDSEWWDIDSGKLFFRPRVWDTNLKRCRYLQDQLKMGFIHRGSCVGVICCSSEKYDDFRDHGTRKAEETLLLLTKVLREASEAFVFAQKMGSHFWFTFAQL